VVCGAPIRGEQIFSLYDELGSVLGEGDNIFFFCFSKGFAKAWITKSMTIEFMCDDDNKIKTMNY